MAVDFINAPYDTFEIAGYVETLSGHVEIVLENSTLYLLIAAVAFISLIALTLNPLPNVVADENITVPLVLLHVLNLYPVLAVPPSTWSFPLVVATTTLLPLVTLVPFKVNVLIFVPVIVSV